MATVHLRAPLKDLAGGNRTVEVDGASVGEALRALEGQHPKIVGWILDEHGRVRPHVNVFLDGERVREDAALEPASTLQVLPSISGGFGGSSSERPRARAEPPRGGGAT
jgi:molybdopterin converting factor small subunit